MKNKMLGIVLVVVAVSILVAASIAESTDSTDMKKPAVLNPPPKSLDRYYPAGGPPLYLLKMFDMATPMEGIVVNVQEGDWLNAEKSYKSFSGEYKNNSLLVPEWKHYFDLNLVNRIGKDISKKDTGAVFEDIGELGNKCEDCHTKNKYQVWIKYNWKDFDNITVNTTNPAEPNAPWGIVMEKYLATNFDGIMINLEEGKHDAANQSFDMFRAQLLDFKDACKNCHTTDRRYFVDNDTFATIDKLGTNVKSNNITVVGQLIGEIGNNVCYECHELHEPAQKVRTLMER